jgi:acetyl-CoA acetyltransferase
MDRKLSERYPAIYMAMIETADIVAERYKVSREYQDEYSVESQKRMGAAQANGLFEDEIVPMATQMKLVDKETKSVILASESWSALTTDNAYGTDSSFCSLRLAVTVISWSSSAALTEDSESTC